MKPRFFAACLLPATLFAVPASAQLTYPIVDTGQNRCYNNTSETGAPAAGQPFYGQDAQHAGNQPSFQDNNNGTVTDLVTGLMWQKSADINNSGTINVSDKLTYDQAVAYAATLNAQNFGGHSDWRLPNIKELYSLIDFRGTDPSGVPGNDTSSLTPFINSVFTFGYGDTAAGERIIDAQYASSTLYAGDNSTDANRKLFGVNFADGRIKGYGLTINGRAKTFYVKYVRGNTSYGANNFVDNGNNTITDNATGLMWAKNDSGAAKNWQEALAWVQAQNAANYLGHNDWRLPNVKELQSIVDYTRSPSSTSSAAISALFNSTAITNEAGQADYPSYYSGTTHASTTNGTYAAYVAFGRAMGYMGSWIDVHGAGAQRSDPKSGNPASYPTGHGPQGDAIRIYNYVRLVRAAGTATAQPDIRVNDPRAQLEGSAAAPGSVNFTVTLSAASTQTVTVNYQTANGVNNGAVAGSDYVAKSGTLTFAPGETSKTIRVDFIGDAVAELNETLFLDLRMPTNARITDSRGAAYIRNDDGPGIAIANARTVNEGHAGTTPQTFIVTLSAASEQTVTVDYATANGTAGPNDYTVTGGTLTFAPGETSKTITVLVKGDTVVEPNETYKVNLSRPTYAVLADSQAVAYIRNDDTTQDTVADEPSY